MFINYYQFPRCACEWPDVWPCQADDGCPNCGFRHISPSASEDAAENTD
jgi:hypothetical protein